MKRIGLTATQARDFWAGSDGAFYTPVKRVEAVCAWCERWGHPVGLYHRQVLFTPGGVMVCRRLVRRVP